MEQLSGGRLLLGGEPPRLIRLSEKGAAALGTALGESGDRPLSAPEARLLEHLRAAGLVHELPTASPGVLDVTVVIPVRQPAPHLASLVAALCSEPACQVVVVDDASSDGGRATRQSTAGRAEVIWRDRRGGPGAARNTAQVATTFVAYLDADIVLEPADPLGWLRLCLAHFAESRLALVAPRVRSLTGEGDLAAYEAAESPLDLGVNPGEVGAFRRLSYVPAAALVARTSALGELNGFEESLRYGEDVDLVRRLERAGWKVAYEPAATVWHTPRSSLVAFARQRFGYGTAAGRLEARHKGTVPPFAASPAAALTAGSLVGSLALAGGECPGAAAAGLGAAGLSWLFSQRRLGRKLETAGCPAPFFLAARLVSKADGSASAALLRAFRRAWWPLGLVLLAGRRPRRALGALALLSALTGRFGVLRQRASQESRPLRAVLSHLGLGLLDDLCYTAGLWAGCARSRSLAVLAPRLLRARQTAR